MIDMNYYKDRISKLHKQMRDSCLMCKHRMDCETYLDWLLAPPSRKLPKKCDYYIRIEEE